VRFQKVLPFILIPSALLVVADLTGFPYYSAYFFLILIFEIK